MNNPRPNILMICSDQHTPRAMGFAGDTLARTPHLDALAAESCVFESFYCNDPICVPSRMSLMTGRFPFQCEVFSNQDTLDSRYPTLAHVAVRGGYHSVLSGKMHFAGPDQRHGFLERLMGEPSSCAVYGGMDNPIKGKTLSDLGNCSKPDPLFQVGAGHQPFVEFDRAVTDASIRWLEKYAQSTSPVPPFFMMTGWLLPHCPFIAPKEFFERHRARAKAPAVSPGEIKGQHPFHHSYRDLIELETVPPENLDKAAAAYYALLEIMDQNLGRLIDALKMTGLWDSTIVLYFSDHGEMLGRHGRWHKESFFEDSARVPMMVRHPSRQTVSTVTEHGSLVDLMPTLCEWVGVTPPPGLPGTSFVSALEGKAGAGPERVAKTELYSWWHNPSSRMAHGASPHSAEAARHDVLPPGYRDDLPRPYFHGNRMVRRGAWKLCYYGAFDSYELFNLTDDPEEKRDLASSPAHQGTLRELSPLLFDDGWTEDAVRLHLARMEKMGYRENTSKFSEAVRKDTLFVDCADYWREIENLETSVSES